MNRREALKRSGLYAGVSLSAASVMTLMQSCQSGSKLGWEPRFCSMDQAKTMAQMVDHLLPKTSTPSATDLGVDRFVDLMFAEALAPEDQEHVRQGMERFEAACQETYGKAFHKITSDQQREALVELGEKTNQFNPSIWGSTLGEQPPIDFYRRLRQFALLGYFTSEEIGKNVLAYDPIPGNYDGCADLTEDQKIWSL